MPQAVPNRTIVVWRRRLGAALRIAVACAVVGLSTLYGPAMLRREVAFPSFSYVTAVVIIVSEATLGDTLRGTWQALVATLLVMVPSVTSLWLIGPGRFTPELAALAVALGAFWVAVAESTSILAKRIAFGQMVIVYVRTVVLGEKAGVVEQPFHVAASTAMGAMSSIVAMLIPFPRLASDEMKRKCECYAENATQRLIVFMKAIVDEDSSEEASDLLAKMKSLSEKASRFLRSIERHQDAMYWERPWLRLRTTPSFIHPAERLQEVEITMEGLEMALASCQSRRLKESLGQQVKNELRQAADQVRLRIEQISCSLSSASSTVPELKDDDQTQELAMDTWANPEHLPVLFILQCMNRLKEGSQLVRNREKSLADHGSDLDQKGIRIRRILHGLLPRTSKQKILFALKCSLSLGVAMLLGLIYTKQNGYWSGLIIAISFVESRHATFSVANARAQGTALGSVYGVIAYIICHKYGLLKLASLLPWIVFTTFLRHSKMYGEAGGISAMIAALLILGRKVFGTPTEFATARLIESFIGLSCFVVVEILMRPERAAMLAKSQVSQCFRSINSLLEEMALRITQIKSESGSSLLEDKRREMNILVHELKRLVQEAMDEPNFWFTPFPGDCYTALLQSVTRVADTLFFMAYSIEVLCSNLHRQEAEWKGYKDQMSVNIGLFKNEITSALESMEETMSSNNSSARDGRELQNNISNDIEMGEPVPHLSRLRFSDIDRDEAETILNFFWQNTRDLTESGQLMENVELKQQIFLSLGSVAFCMRSLVTETAEISKVVKEIIQRENL